MRRGDLSECHPFPQLAMATAREAAATATARSPRAGGSLSDRLPPQNLEAEQAVLGSILLDNDVLHEVVPVPRRRRLLPRRAPDHLPGDPRPVRPGQGDRRGHPGRRADPPRPVQADRRRRDAAGDRQQRPARGQRQVLRRDRPPEVDQPPADRERQPRSSATATRTSSPPQQLLEVGRAADLHASPRTRSRARPSSSRRSSRRRWT